MNTEELTVSAAGETFCSLSDLFDSLPQKRINAEEPPEEISALVDLGGQQDKVTH